MTCQDDRYTATMEARFRLEGKVQIKKLYAGDATTAIHIEGRDCELIITTKFPRELVETLKRVIDGDMDQEWEAIL